MQLSTVLFLIAFGVFKGYCAVSFEGYKVYEVTPSTEAQLNLLSKFHDDNNYDFWSHPRGLNYAATIMVSPDAQTSFEAKLSDYDFGYNILINNVQTTIDEEDTRQRIASMTRSEVIGDVSFTHYMQYDDINSYMKRLARDYPNIVNLVDFGRSYEGREMFLIEISTDNFTSNKPLILVDAGIHSREWVAPPTALYLIHQLVENASNSALYQNVNWAVVPVLNPDGYVFTITDNRMWRKTRTPPNGTTCYGTDPNRNFDYQWMTGGASANQCTETFAGPEPFSEIECRNLRDYMIAHQNEIKLYLSIHSYGNWLLYPWGYTTDLPDDDEELYNLGTLVNDRIRAYNGTEYVYGPSSVVLYVTSGDSTDYAKGALGIELTYTIELPGGGSVGFNPPANRIRPIVEEFYEGLLAYHQYIEEKFVTNATNRDNSAPYLLKNLNNENL